MFPPSLAYIELLKTDVGCKSADVELGDFNTLAECGSACWDRFVFAKRPFGHFCVVLIFDCLKIL